MLAMAEADLQMSTHLCQHELFPNIVQFMKNSTEKLEKSKDDAN